MSSSTPDEVVAVLNRLLEAELQAWCAYPTTRSCCSAFRAYPRLLAARAGQRIACATRASGRMDHRAGRLSLAGDRPLLDSLPHDMSAILKESLANGSEALKLYRQLLQLVEGGQSQLEEFARQMTTPKNCTLPEVDKICAGPESLRHMPSRSG